MLCWVLDRVVEMPWLTQMPCTDTNTGTLRAASKPLASLDNTAKDAHAEKGAETTKARTMLKFPGNCWTDLSAAINQSSFLAFDCVAHIRKPNELRQRVCYWLMGDWSSL